MALGALLAGAGAGAQAAWACTDAFGNRYLVRNAVGETLGLQCQPLADEPPPAFAPAPSPGADEPRAGEPARWAAVGEANAGSPSRGGLVLAAPAGYAAALPLPMARRAEFDRLIESVARATGQDADLLRAIVQVESHFDPDAVSAKGAIGLMQVMPSTAAELGLQEPQRMLFQPEANLRIGALHLRRLADRFPGTPELAIAAYNAGLAAVVRSGFAIPPYAETQAYVRDVLGLYRALRAAR